MLRFKKFSDIAMYIIYILYSFFALLLTYYYFSDYKTPNYAFVLIGYLLSCSIGILIIRKLSDYLNRKMGRPLLLFMLLICFALKFTWVLAYTIKPNGDYETFYNLAAALSRQNIVNSRYIALFPHIMGYSLFLSTFIKSFGAYYLIAPIINVFLSVISLALLYYICKKIAGSQVAIIAGALWTVMPSQTIYNMFTLSEPLYTAELLAILALTVFVDKKFEKMTSPKLILCSFVIAFLLDLLNMTRPIAAILLIALASWIFIVDIRHINSRRTFLMKGAFIFAIIISYIFLSYFSNQYIAARLGEEPATLPGFNIYVGLNENYSGTWNSEDSALLWEYSSIDGFSANDAQKRMLLEARKRLKNVDLSQLMHRKFILFLADDCAAISYADSVLKHTGALRVICNAFYYFVITFSAFGALAAAKAKNKSPIFIICIYAVGLTMAHMAVEVAGRYHYSIIISMIVLAAYGIDYLGSKISEHTVMLHKRHRLQ